MISEAIGREAAHLWSFEPEALREPAIAERWLERLQDHEWRRYAAYGTAAARREYLATRALVRTALAHYSGEAPERLRFGVDRSLRPELTSPAMPGLCFSLARTRGLAVGLFGSDRPLGVDVECVAPIDVFEVAERYFSAAELTDLRALDEAARPARFYALWTLREAYLKARGVGLTLPLDQLAFAPTPAGGVRAEFGPAIDDDPEGWQFALIWLTERHLAATCVRRSASGAATRIDRFDARAMDRERGS